MRSSLIEPTDPRENVIGRPWKGGASAWSSTPLRAESSVDDEDDPFDDFDEDDFDDDFDDDFEEDWEDDLTEDNEFPDTFGGHEEENPEGTAKKAPFNDDPDFDK